MVALSQVIVEVLDYNDELPVFPFSQYDITVQENTPVGQVVVELQADDEDSQPVVC